MDLDGPQPHAHNPDDPGAARPAPANPAPSACLPQANRSRRLAPIPPYPSLPNPDDLQQRGWHRPRKSPVPVKRVTFQGESAIELARRIEAKAWFENVRINDLMLHLLRRGLQADNPDSSAKGKSSQG